MIRIEELQRVTQKSLAGVNALLPQLSKTAKPLSLKLLETIVKDKNTQLVTARSKNKIVGMGSLVFTRTPYGLRARIEDVVVDEHYRGKGIGEKISKALITLAKKAKVRRVELSTRQTRVAARKLYEKLGFEKRKSDVYVRFLEKRKRA